MSRLADYLAALDAMETLGAMLGEPPQHTDEIELSRVWLEDEA